VTTSASQRHGDLGAIRDTVPQAAEGKVLWHFTMSLDGFVAGVDHSMEWMKDFTIRDGLVGEYVETTGAVLGGRKGWDVAGGEVRPYGGAWHGPIFVLTHHPEDATPADGVTFLSGDVSEAVRIALEAAGGKNVEVFSPSIGQQLLELGLVDEIDLHVAPVLLGGGVRLFDSPGGTDIRLQLENGGDPLRAVNLRYRPKPHAS
jgi:dihydrofolate reductase